jgi:N utilization substance protein A
MKSDFIIALTQLAAERNLPRDIVLSAIEAALVSAYKRDSVTAGQDISVSLDPGTGDVSVFIVKTVAEEIEDTQLEISLEDARKIKPDAEMGEVVATETLPHSAGRIAAQTAKQVVLQRLREAERELVFQEYADKEGEVYTVTVQRIEPKQVIVELGRAEAIMPPSEQVPAERYRVGMKFKALLQSIRRSNKGPEIIVSRTDKLLLRRLFELEVPEIFNGAVEIVAIAREPGWRSKVAVFAKQDGVDAIGSCVGLRGIRIQSIVNELHGEKIDVVQWNKDPAAFLSSALSPSQVMRVDIDVESGSAVAVVPERQLSLAIGKEGQNARLAARLTGWRVDIKGNVEDEAARHAQLEAPAVAGAVETVDQLGLTTRVLNALKQAGVETVAQVLKMAEADLLQIEKFGQKSLVELQGRLAEHGLTAGAVLETVPEPVAAEPVAEEPTPVVEVPVEEVAGEPEPVLAEAEAVVEEVVAESVAVEAAVETPAPAEPPKVVPEPVPVEAIPEELLAPEPVVEEPVPVGERSALIQDLPDNIWQVRATPAASAGGIRFAEDIEELRRGTGPRRGRRSGGGGGAGGAGGAGGRGRKTKVRKRR